MRPYMSYLSIFATIPLTMSQNNPGLKIEEFVPSSSLICSDDIFIGLSILVFGKQRRF